MQFEWDEAKDTENIRKHRIDFSDVPAMFDGPMLIEHDERMDYGEERWSGIGFLRHRGRCRLEERLHDVVRIISARMANQYEQTRFTRYLTYRLVRLNGMTDEDIDYSDIPHSQTLFLSVPSSRYRLHRRRTSLHSILM